MALSLTENAINEVKKVKEEQNFTDEVLAVSVTGGGCSGFKYKMAFIPLAEVDEKKYNSYTFGDFRVVVDKRSEMYLGDTTIDFYQGLEQRGFLFENPQATGKCGCGSSFSV